MTAPIWMACPPEVHSTLLGSGPGPGPLLASATAWHSLSVSYAEVAEELTALLAAVQAGAWEGPTAARWSAAHLPYIAWLLQASANSAAAAAAQETSATAYTAALAAMPTLPELATNHAIHAALLGTNFFGINTIPIAFNEADYLRMWIQAALTMSLYHATSTVAVEATPQTAAAPPIEKMDAMPGDGQGNSGMGGDTGGGMRGGMPMPPNPTGPMGTMLPTSLDQLINNIFPPFFNPFSTQFGLMPNGQIMTPSLATFLPRAEAMLTGYAGNPLQLIEAIAYLGTQFIVHRTLFLINILLTNPGMLGAFIVANPIYSAGLAAPLAAAPVAAASGTAGLAGLASLTGIPAPVAAVAAPVPVGAPPMPPGGISPAPLPASPAPVAPTAPVASAPIAPPPSAPPPATPAPPPLLGSEGAMGAHSAIYPYLATVFPARAKSSVRRKTARPASDMAATPAAAAATTARRHVTRHHRPAGKMDIGRGYRYEFLDADFGPDGSAASAVLVAGGQTPQTTASGHGADEFGFAGTATKTTAQAAGLTTLVSDDLSESPKMPMMPGSWDPEASPLDQAPSD